MTWKDKANQIIAEFCLIAYKNANPIRGRRHKPYIVPPIAQKLVECLRTNDETAAKDIFVRLACGTICDMTV